MRSYSPNNISTRTITRCHKLSYTSFPSIWFQPHSDSFSFFLENIIFFFTLNTDTSQDTTYRIQNFLHLIPTSFQAHNVRTLLKCHFSTTLFPSTHCHIGASLRKTWSFVPFKVKTHNTHGPAGIVLTEDEDLKSLPMTEDHWLERRPSVHAIHCLHATSLHLSQINERTNRPSLT